MLHMKNILAIILIIITILIILPFPSSAIDNGYARIVYNVRGLQDYDLHWNNRFPQGSIIQVYNEADGVNHRRAVAVDYIFIIKDSNNNIVDSASYSNRYEDYRENDFLTYSKEVPQGWEDGVYTAEIHIMDLLNDSIMNKYYEDVTLSYLNGSSKPDIPVMERSDIFNLTEADKQRQIINITQTFYIDKYASKYPMDRFRVENFMLDRTIVAPNVPVQVSVNISNTFYEPGTTSLSLLMDNKLIDDTAVEIGGYGTRQVSFAVSSATEGKHTIEIIPTGSNTVGVNLLGVFNVSIQKEIEIPTTFSIKDLQVDRLSVGPNEPVIISVTVENKGKEGSLPVEIDVNGVLEEERSVNLNFSEIKEIRFNITKPELGSYRVSVANSNLSKLFFVELSTSTPAVTVEPAQEKKPEFKYILWVSAAVIFIFILRLYLRRKLK